VTLPTVTESKRRDELLDRAYEYVLQKGLARMSLRPLAAAVGSSPRVLLYLFGSKDGLVRALLARARADELAFLERFSAGAGQTDLRTTARLVWDWLVAPEHRGLLALWLEAYAGSLIDADACGTASRPSPWRIGSTFSHRHATSRPAAIVVGVVESDIRTPDWAGSCSVRMPARRHRAAVESVSAPVITLTSNSAASPPGSRSGS
jgi:AcrR family transcriptional regulator